MMGLLATSSLRGQLQRLALALLVITLAVAGGLLALLWQAQRSADSVYADRVVPLVQLKRVSDAYAVTVVDTLHKTADGRMDAVAAEAALAAALRDARRDWLAYLDTELVPEERQRIASIQPLMARADVTVGEALLLLHQQDAAALDAFRAERLYPALDPLTVQLDALAQVQERVTLEQLEQGRLRLRWAIAISGLAVLVAVALGALLAHRLGAGILGGVDRAVQHASALAAGEPVQPSRERHEPEELRALQDALQEVARQLNAAMSQAEALAHRDVLTGLHNQRGLDDALDVAVARLRRQGEGGAVIAIDLDRFRVVNELYGRAVGDEVLRICALRLRDCLRDIDVLARVSGASFVALLQGSTADNALMVAERMRRGVAEPPPATLPRDLRLTASLGVSLLLPGERGELALARALRATQAAKSNGRNRVETS